jgi:hypothetical protein
MTAVPAHLNANRRLTRSVRSDAGLRRSVVDNRDGLLRAGVGTPVGLIYELGRNVPFGWDAVAGIVKVVDVWSCGRTQRVADAMCGVEFDAHSHCPPPMSTRTPGVKAIGSSRMAHTSPASSKRFGVPSRR